MMAALRIYFVLFLGLLIIFILRKVINEICI
jgi:hypothetical protein